MGSEKLDVRSETLPEGWTISQLKHFVTVNNGKEIGNEVASSSENAIRVFGSGGVFKYTDKFLYEGEAVLFGRKGTLGKPIYTEGKFWAVDTMYFLTFKGSLLAKYCYYMLSAFDWQPFITQTALPSIVASEIVAQKFPIPPLTSQLSLLTFLDRKCAEIDELAALQETMIAELKRYKQSVITEAVTKGLDKNVKMKDSGVEWIGEKGGERLDVRSETLPEGWTISQLKHFVTVNNGKEIGNEVASSSENAIRVFGSGGVFKYTDKFLYEGEAVLFGRKGTLGKPIYTERKFWAVDTMYFLTFKGSLLAKYCYYMLSAFDWQPFITQTALPSIVASEIVAQKFPIPPLTSQLSLLTFLDRKCAEIDELIAIKQQKIEALKEYKKSVIFEYVTGKIQLGMGKRWEAKNGKL